MSLLRPVCTCAIALALVSAPIGAAAPANHVCSSDEGKGACAISRVRMCTSGGELAECACPPGASAPAATASCALDPRTPPAQQCVVFAPGLSTRMGAYIDFGELAVPSLATFASPRAHDRVSSAARRVHVNPETLRIDLPVLECVQIAEAHEALEGEAAYRAAHAFGPKAQALAEQRDAALVASIEVRQALGSCAGSLDADQRDRQSIALARAWLRRAAYAGPGPRCQHFRSDARKLLTAVLAAATSTAPSASARTAAFVLAEEAIRERSWTDVADNARRVLQHAAARTDVDDVAYAAAAYARLAQAKLELGDLEGAKGALELTITTGLKCAPRAECVSAAAAARNTLAGVWGATGASGRTLVPLLREGRMPRQERVRPLIQLAELFTGAKTEACRAAADEAYAWAQLLR